MKANKTTETSGFRVNFFIRSEKRERDRAREEMIYLIQYEPTEVFKVGEIRCLD